MRLCAVNVVILRAVISARTDVSNCSCKRKYLREDDHVRVRMDQLQETAGYV